MRSPTIRSLFQSAKLRKRESPASRNRHASAARSAVGRPDKKTVGSAHADTSGTRSTAGESAPPASTSGLRPSASLAADGRCIRTGMLNKSTNAKPEWHPVRRLSDNRIEIEPYDPCYCGGDKKVKFCHPVRNGQIQRPSASNYKPPGPQTGIARAG